MRRALLAVLLASVTCAARADEPALAPYAECDAATRALIAKVVAAFGGEPALGAIETIRGVADIHQREDGTDSRMVIEALASFPERYFARIHTTQGTMTIAINAQDAYVIPAKASVSGAAIRLTAEERDDLVHYFASDPLFVLKNRKSPRYFFASGPLEKFGDVQCQRLMVYADGLRLDWLVDLATGRIVRIDAGGQVSELSDWKPVGRVPVPREVRTTESGKPVSEMHYVEYEINPSIEVEPIFRRPDLWLMRWKVQPKPGPVTIAGAGEGEGSDAGANAEKSAASYKPPDIVIDDGSTTVWDPGTGAPIEPPPNE